MKKYKVTVDKEGNTIWHNENKTAKQSNIHVVNGSALLPDGWKVYKCTDCQEINVKKDNRQITVGFCDNCEHPLWNDEVDEVFGL